MVIAIALPVLSYRWAKKGKNNIFLRGIDTLPGEATLVNSFRIPSEKESILKCQNFRDKNIR